MFYSEELLTNKNGALSIIWLAATLGPTTKRITKRDVHNVDFSRTCELIAEPPEPMALRLSGSLLVGVARVYGRSCEIFFTDVTEFHSAIRRSLAFQTTAIGAGGTAGIDLPNAGKSRTDLITFDDIDISWRSVIDVDFVGIDWRNPFGKRPRRELSVVSTLHSQQVPGHENDHERHEEEDDEEEYGLEEGRNKRQKVASSPAGARPRKDSTINRPSQLSNGPAPLQDQIDLPEDFVLFTDGPGGGDSSIDLPDLDNTNGNISPPGDNDFFPPMDFDFPPAEAPNGEQPAPDANGVADQGAKVRAPRTRENKLLRVDQIIEINDRDVSERAYNEAMDEAHAAVRAQDADKVTNVQATEMVNGAGNWIDFFHPDMKAFFATVTKAGTFQWEQEMIAHKAGRKWTPVNGDAEGRPENANGHADHGEVDQNPFLGGDPHTSGDTSFGPGPMESGGMDVWPDMPFDHAPQRASSIDHGVEVARALSQSQRAQPLPWEAPRSTHGNDDLPGGIAGFTPGPSLRLSIMTPQEVRIRRMLRSSSGKNPLSSMRPREVRSRSGSVLGTRGIEDAQMLIGGDDDDELPRESQLGITASQAMDRDDIPDAFQPEMLATLEKQCREFLSYVEDRAGEDQGEIDFDDVIPKTSPIQVAAIAFYNCLTLVTKQLLKVDQPEAWGPITISLAA